MPQYIREASTPLVPQSILIVEDDDLLRDLTAESLSSVYAVNIVVCANADEALHRLSHDETPTLVVTDIHMPGHLDGLALAQEIWRKWPSLPVIFMEALLQPEAFNPKTSKMLVTVAASDYAIRAVVVPASVS